MLVLALIAALSACGAHHVGSGATTAVVVAHHRSEPAPVLGAADLARLRTLAADPDSDDVVVHVVSAGRGDVETVDLEPRRPNGDIERGPRVDALVEERLVELDRAVGRAAAQSRDTDLLRALASAGRTGASTIVVLSSGLSTVDPLDLRIAGWDRDPADVAAELRDRRLLPDLTADVVFSGLGRTVAPQPPLGIREQAQLRDLWLAVCAATGARCHLDDSPRPAAPPVSPLAQPLVPVPAVSTSRGPDGTETVQVPARLLFGPDSCALVDPAGVAAVIGPLADRIRDGRFSVTISGRTAPVGGPGIELSTCRARAAESLLYDHGVPADAVTEVRGDGSLLDPPGASRDAAGDLDPGTLSALRRVVFTLVPVQEIR